MTCLLTATPADRIAAQRIAYRLALARDKWKPGDTSLFLMPPQEMEQIFVELAQLREFKAKHEKQ